MGRKLLIAGSSGLNITNHLPLREFASHYRHDGDPAHFERVLGAFPPSRWISHIESLGIKTFEGSSGRYFIEDKKASGFLKAWRERLIQQGVVFQFGTECVSITKGPPPQLLTLHFADGTKEECTHVALALGGASWEPDESPLRWPSIFEEHQIRIDPFASSNAGYEIAWSKEFLSEAEGLPLKNALLRSKKGSRRGEIMVTAYGIEGTPVYFVGTTGEASIDLLPDLTEEEVAGRLESKKENLSPMRRIMKTLSLSAASQALIFHHSNPEIIQSRNFLRIAGHLKNFPLNLIRARPLTEAISSSGGVAFSEVDQHLMLRKIPGAYVAGEMLSWDAPTGGFLIQGAVSQGHWVASRILDSIRTRR